jgi:tryptophan halogenase
MYSIPTHICIIGTGTAGWMAANFFVSNNHKVTIIGSPHIPPIGVGESNTMALPEFHRRIGIDTNEFIRQSDATVKTGVYYKGWSKNNFIHNFKNTQPFKDLDLISGDYWQSFGNKPIDKPFHFYYGNDLIKAIDTNHFFPQSATYSTSYHFDAGKYIQFLSNNVNGRVTVINDTVQDVIFHKDEEIEALQLSDCKFSADYYIFATGSNQFNETKLKVKYNDLSNVLLTNKAFVYPLEFTNKRDQFTPYTAAKTMASGWRWITPTYSRIGTGYVFSDRHITQDQALQEFLDDIGDHSIEPRLVDFHPRYSEKTFYNNYCLIGMANGFLEPLDAPGLTLTIDVLFELYTIFHQISFLKDHIKHYAIEKANGTVAYLYQFWASFILHQYKTSMRNDTEFWIDHHHVNYPFYQDLIDFLYSAPSAFIPINSDMFYYTGAAKDVQWNLPYEREPIKLPSAIRTSPVHHLDYIQQFH